MSLFVDVNIGYVTLENFNTFDLQIFFKKPMSVHLFSFFVFLFLVCVHLFCVFCLYSGKLMVCVCSSRSGRMWGRVHGCF